MLSGGPRSALGPLPAIALVSAGSSVVVVGVRIDLPSPLLVLASYLTLAFRSLQPLLRGGPLALRLLEAQLRFLAMLPGLDALRLDPSLTDTPSPEHEQSQEKYRYHDHDHDDGGCVHTALLSGHLRSPEAPND